MTIINPEHPAASGRLRLLLTVEVARQLSLSERQVARLRQAGALKCVRISGSAARHTQAQVDAFIAERSNDA